MIFLQNATPIELAWTVLNLIGLTAAVLLLGAWVSRLGAIYRLAKRGQAGRLDRAIAWDRVRKKIGYTVVFFTGTWLGLVAMVAPPRLTATSGPVEAWAYNSFQQGIVPVFFVLVGVPAILMVWTVIEDWKLGHLEGINE